MMPSWNVRTPPTKENKRKNENNHQLIKTVGQNKSLEDLGTEL